MKSMNICRSQFRRLIELDRQIRAGLFPNCASFAEEWEVSRKTIQRDIEFLRDHDAPLQYNAARNGYCYADRAWMLPMLDLSEAELLQLLMAERMARLFRGTPIADGLEALFEKLRLALTDKVTVDPVFFREQFSFHGQPTREISKTTWVALFKALRGDRVIRVSYRTPPHKDAVERTIEPLHLACIGDEWYLIARLRKTGELRHLSMSRILRVKVTDVVFDAETFDPDSYFSNRFGRFVGRPGEAYTVKVRFSAEIAPWVLERVWHPLQKTQKHKDGKLTLTFPAPSLYEIKRWVLQWGDDAQVLAPKELREDVYRTARSMVELLKK